MQTCYGLAFDVTTATMQSIPATIVSSAMEDEPGLRIQIACDNVVQDAIEQVVADKQTCRVADGSREPGTAKPSNDLLHRQRGQVRGRPLRDDGRVLMKDTGTVGSLRIVAVDRDTLDAPLGSPSRLTDHEDGGRAKPVDNFCHRPDTVCVGCRHQQAFDADVTRIAVQPPDCFP